MKSVLFVGLLALATPACSKKQSAPSQESGASTSGSTPSLTAAEAVTRWQANKGAMMNKPVSVKGYFVSSSTQGGTINLLVNQNPKGDKLSDASPLCVLAPSERPKVDKLRSGDPIVAKGDVTGGFFDAPLLSKCTLE